MVHIVWVVLACLFLPCLAFPLMVFSWSFLASCCLSCLAICCLGLACIFVLVMRFLILNASMAAFLCISLGAAPLLVVCGSLMCFPCFAMPHSLSFFFDRAPYIYVILCLSISPHLILLSTYCVIRTSSSAFCPHVLVGLPLRCVCIDSCLSRYLPVLSAQLLILSFCFLASYFSLPFSCLCLDSFSAVRGDATVNAVPQKAQVSRLRVGVVPVLLWGCRFLFSGACARTLVMEFCRMAMMLLQLFRAPLAACARRTGRWRCRIAAAWTPSSKAGRPQLARPAAAIFKCGLCAQGLDSGGVVRRRDRQTALAG